MTNCLFAEQQKKCPTSSKQGDSLLNPLLLNRDKGTRQVCSDGLCMIISVHTVDGDDGDDARDSRTEA